MSRFREPTFPERDLLSLKPDLLTLMGYEVSTSNGGKPVHYRQS